MFVEARRHDPDHGDGPAVEAERVANEIGIANEAADSGGMAEGDHLVLGWLVLPGGKHAPERRRHAENGKEIGGDLQAAQAVRRLARLGEER